MRVLVTLAGLLGLLIGSTHSKVVHIRNGSVQGGKCETTDVNYFFSIPYAQPPVGDLRLAPPQPPSNSTYKVLNGTNPAPSCIQFGSQFVEAGPQSEDCLFLNVWAPASVTPGSNLPVKVWLYGGANSAGGISSPLYNGCFSATDSIIVSINYRVGPLGFLALSDLGLSGNYAIMDQLLGLRWVQENISGFGGNPKNVLLYGESAGATDAFTIATLPEATQLMRTAALESGAGRDIATVADAQVWQTEFIQALNCSNPDLSCLRTVSPSAMQAADTTISEGLVLGVNSPLNNNGSRSSWTPLIDGTLIAEQPSTAGLRIPSIVGSNANEGALFVLSAYRESVPTLGQSDYDVFLTSNFGPLAPRVNETYSLQSVFNGSASTAIAAVVTAASYTCKTRRTLLQAEKNGIPVWTYLFGHPPSCPWVADIPTQYVSLLGATHSSEIPFVFNMTAGMPPPDGNCTFSETERALSNAMSRAWTNMAASGRPGDEATWPAWTSDKVLGVKIQNTMGITTMDYGSCTFWDEINDELNQYWETQKPKRQNYTGR
ncbi:alpha/beta-hydrolase [Xylariaceae sp. FL0662B]|nr:alpha/beta-hydrolase [Xylariaceae sp. FL0662B]